MVSAWLFNRIQQRIGQQDYDSDDKEVEKDR